MPPMVSYLYVAAAILLRLAPHPWNVTPLGSMFLFGGATFKSRAASLLVPLAALMLSDLFVVTVVWGGRYDWYTPYTWIAFLLVGLIGWLLRGRMTGLNVLAASLAGSIVFFVVSNFGVWLNGLDYPQTREGLVECYIAALPFFRNAILGDLFYAGLMFGSYHWLSRRIPRLRAS
jgi:uncharacterized protein DUF6580